jgi:hypothetical protein
MAVETINHASLRRGKTGEADGSIRPGTVEAARGAAISLSFLFDQTTSQLSNIDFDRALRLTQLIEMKEARVFAQLGVCGGALR